MAAADDGKQYVILNRRHSTAPLHLRKGIFLNILLCTRSSTTLPSPDMCQTQGAMDRTAICESAPRCTLAPQLDIQLKLTLGCLLSDHKAARVCQQLCNVIHSSLAAIDSPGSAWAALHRDYRTLRWPETAAAQPQEINVRFQQAPDTPASSWPGLLPTPSSSVNTTLQQLLHTLQWCNRKFLHNLEGLQAYLPLFHHPH